MAKTTAAAGPKWRVLLVLSVLSTLVGLGAGGWLGWLYWQNVVVDPGEDLERRHILGVIAEESPVYFRDGHTRLGVFFADEHRDQVGWGDLPRAWVASIVAAEDDSFWTHPGFDLLHLARAMVDNVIAGHTVAGGSTLTQQTAKNLYYRPDRSFKAKLVEALYALRLERHYSKEDILTFYANQFHVSGNGRGLGIAARYFFDKEVGQLSTVEAAFLAGLVKAPSYYDPFSGDAAKQATAVQRAEERTRYVLRRLGEEPAEKLAGPEVSGQDSAAVAAFQGRVAEVKRVQADARDALEKGFTLNFKHGAFRFDTSVVLDEVARRLSEAPFADALKAAGIDDPARAGLKVITTLDKDAQRSAVYGLWHHLTEVGVMLEGKTTADFLREGEQVTPLMPGERVSAMEFRLANVIGPADDGGKKVLKLDLGGLGCTVDRDGLVRVAAAVQRAKAKSATSKVNGAEVDAFAAALPAGKVVWVSLREAADDRVLCDLELRPELQGAVMALEHGEIRAMVGGSDNRNYNRTAALRQMGSTWKGLVLSAALELGWSPTDRLDNRRNVFPFSTTFYYPRPDHSPAPDVGLAWAGTTSENLASVWLLYHLTDRLSDEQVAKAAAAVGLGRGASESAEAYRTRLQRLGIQASTARLEEASFLAARREVAASLAAAGRDADALAVTSMLYGWGFDNERASTTDASKLEALQNTWLSLRDRRAVCGDQYQRLADGWSRAEVPADVPDLSVLVEPDRVRVVCGHAGDGWTAPSPELFAAGPGPLVDEAEMRIDGRISASALDALRSEVERRQLERELKAGDAVDAYDPSLIVWNQDFRVLLGLRYVHRLAQRYGVQSPVREVMALPLGASEMTLEELAKVYEGLATGTVWTFPGEATGPAGTTAVAAPPSTALLISEIRDVEDKVIYRAKPVGEQPAPPEVSAMTADIFRQVVDWGTGRRGKGVITVGGSALPIGGKTGTTNDFKNAAFVGFAPVAGAPDLSAAWTVAVYVGYDDNRPMSVGGIKLAGASGAMPAWLHTVRGITIAGLLGDVTARAPDGGWKPRDPDGSERVHVDGATGLPASAETAGPEVLVRKAAPVAVVVTQIPDQPGPEAQTPVVPRIGPATREPGSNGGGIWSQFKKRQAAPEAVPKGAPAPPPPAAPK
jgi:penicillin-binding protein 1A